MQKRQSRATASKGHAQTRCLIYVWTDNILAIFSCKIQNLEQRIVDAEATRSNLLLTGKLQVLEAPLKSRIWNSGPLT